MRYIYYKEVIAPSDLIEPLKSYIAILALMYSYIVLIHSYIAFLALLALKAALRCFKAYIAWCAAIKPIGHFQNIMYTKGCIWDLYLTKVIS